MSGLAARRRVRIVNPMGLHARPAGRFVAEVERHAAQVRVRCNGEEVDGGSILSLLMLEAVQGVALEIEAQGDDATQAVEALAALVARGFEEADDCVGRGARD